MARAYLFQVIATTTNASLGIVALMILTTRPVLAIALVPPVVLVLAGQIAASESQRRADRNEFLYRTTEILHSTRQVGERAGELLNGITTMFGVERAELVVIPEVRGPAVRFSSTGDDDHAAGHHLGADLRRAGGAQRAAHHRDPQRFGGDAISRSGWRLRNARRAPARWSCSAGSRVRRACCCCSTRREASKLGAHEQSLLSTVAGLISVALENGQLAEAIKAMSVEKAELARRAFYDPLTQIANRSLFIETVATSLASSPSSQRPIAVMFIDLDGFKEINDTFGHAVGDRVLSEVAARLRVQVRKLDLAARIGGDEFGMLLDGMRHYSDAAVVADRIIETLRRPIPLGDAVITIGASVGVAVVDDAADAPEPEELMRRADMAMYLAKRQGKNRFVVFDETARTPVIAQDSRTRTAGRRLRPGPARIYDGRVTPPRCLSIATSDSGGGAGIQADLKAFAAAGCHGMTAIVGVTAQNTTAILATYPLPVWVITAQLEAVYDDIGVDAAKTGALLSAEIIVAVADFLARHPTPLVVDPVLRASTGAPLLDPDAVAVLITSLLPARDGGDTQPRRGSCPRRRRRRPAIACRAHRRPRCPRGADHRW